MDSSYNLQIIICCCCKVCFHILQSDNYFCSNKHRKQFCSTYQQEFYSVAVETLQKGILQSCSTYQHEFYSVAVLTNRNFTVLQYLPKGILQCCSTYQKELYNDKLSPVSIATKLFTEQHAELQKHSLGESDQMESCAPVLLQQQVARGLR